MTTGLNDLQPGDVVRVLKTGEHFRVTEDRRLVSLDAGMCWVIGTAFERGGPPESLWRHLWRRLRGKR